MAVLDPQELGPEGAYRVLVGSILPRPIAFVSTQSPEGELNLAPFSFFTAAGANPMAVCFCTTRSPQGDKKDTLRNIEATGEFVVNVVSEAYAEKMNQASYSYPYGVSEFDKAGFTPEASETVAPPRVQESPIALECRLQQIVELGDGPLSGSLIIGVVQKIRVHDDVWQGDKVATTWKPIGRMAGAVYTRTQDQFELPRPSQP